VIVFLFWFQFEEAWQASLNDRGIGSYLQPKEIPLWQVAAFGSACVTWVMFFRSERFLLFSDSDIATSLDGLKIFFKWAIVLRNFLSVYTAVCTLYITIVLAKTINIPALHLIMFPW
jgi:hypothetical protein